MCEVLKNCVTCVTKDQKSITSFEINSWYVNGLAEDLVVRECVSLDIVYYIIKHPKVGINFVDNDIWFGLVSASRYYNGLADV